MLGKAEKAYEEFRKSKIGKPYKPMYDKDKFVAGYLAASSTTSNNKYMATPKSCLDCKWCECSFKHGVDCKGHRHFEPKEA